MDAFLLNTSKHTAGPESRIQFKTLNENGMNGITRILIPTHDFSGTVAFLDDVMGYAVDNRNASADDPHFVKQATVRTPNGIILEVVEPSRAHAGLFIHPVLSFTVQDLVQTQKRIEAEGLTFSTPTMADTTGRRWTYFRSSENYPYQLSAEPKNVELKLIHRRQEGVEWILAPCIHFDSAVDFFKHTMNLTIQAQGTPTLDLRFHRYAQCQAGNGMVLEIVEPITEQQGLFQGPVVSLTVNDLLEYKTQLENRSLEILSDVIDDSNGWGWFYFRLPGSTTFQLQGPLHP